MVRYNIRFFAYIIIGFAFIVYVLIFIATQDLKNIDYYLAIKIIPTTITINFFIWILFVTWAWKLKLFYPWLIPFPNLSGKWEGYIKSNWDEKQNIKRPIKVSITQNFFNIHVKIQTDESRSYSIGAFFKINVAEGWQELYYIYQNTPKSGMRDRSEIHYGSTVLYFEGFKVSKMEGGYWTDRKTTGEITLIKNH